MVEAFEAATRPESTEPLESDAGAGGLDRIRRLVFSGRTEFGPEPAEAGGEESAPAPEAGEGEMQVDPAEPPPPFAGPPPPPGGQLHDAQPVTPALRLSYRNDARTLREAAVDAASLPSSRLGAR